MKTEMDELKKNLHEAITVICKDYETKHLPEFKVPEFKVGQWVIGKDGYFPNYPARILSITNDYAELDITNGKDYQWKNEKGLYWRLAIPSEIESHLRKICDEKYIGKKVRCLSTEEECIISKNPHWNNRINVANDEFWMIASNGIGVLVYRQGEFVEIIRDKKKLPETKEEFEVFYYRWENSKYVVSPTGFREFLNEYED